MDARSRRSFAFLKFLAADLSRGEISFPTFADATLRVRSALDNPNLNAENLAHVVSTEPLLSARLIKVANSVALNGTGKPAGDLRTAVVRVGFATVRSVAMAVALEQTVAMSDFQAHRAKAEAIWRESVDVAALAYVIARRLSRVNPDEAMLAGLLQDIGKFYLLARVTRYPELATDAAEVERVLDEWHPAIGSAILGSLGLPEATVFAVAEHHVAALADPIRKLIDVLVAANRVAQGPNPINTVNSSAGGGASNVSPAVNLALAESREELHALVGGLRHA